MAAKVSTFHASQQGAQLSRHRVLETLSLEGMVPVDFSLADGPDEVGIKLASIVQQNLID